MNIQTPNEYAKAHGYNPFPPRLERWLNIVREGILAAQPQAGRNVTIDEHPGKGTVINVADTSGRRPGGGGGGPIFGACCYNDGTCDNLTEADCTGAGGNWQGVGTTCTDAPNPCLGACCEGEDGTTCVENSTPDSCAADGGIFHDFGSTCDPNPCITATCGFLNCSDIGFYLTRITVVDWTASNPDAGCGNCSTSGSYTTIEEYNEDCSILTVTCSGSSNINCGELVFSCAWNLVDGHCLAEPTSDCPAAPNELFLTCAHTCDPINDCSGNTFTQTCPANEGSGIITFTQTVS